jgi:ABC-type Mn2+/Zn2+ transport system permease subunit
MKTAIELLQTGFLQDALKAALIIAVMGSFMGVFVVLMRIVFVAAA